MYKSMLIKNLHSLQTTIKVSNNYLVSYLEIIYVLINEDNNFATIMKLVLVMKELNAKLMKPWKIDS